MSEAAGSLSSRLWKFLAKPRGEKLKSVAFRLQSVLPKRAESIDLPFGAKWLARESALDGQLRSGTFETAEVRFVSSFLREGMIVLDIGAHHGLYTLLASRRVGGAGKVFAFEPSPRERRRLKRHVRLNRCTNVAIQAVALGAVNGRENLFLVLGAEDYCNSVRPPAVQAETKKITVKMRTLDDFLRGASVQRVDFIKLDVEGAELEVLKGASELLSREDRPTMLVEVYDVRSAPWGYRAREIVRLLSGVGYRWFRILESGTLEGITPDLDSYDANLVAIPRAVLPKLGKQLPLN